MESIRNRYRASINDRNRNKNRRRFASESSIDIFNTFLKSALSESDFSPDLSHAFQHNVDHFIALLMDSDSSGKKELVIQITHELSPWQKGKFITLLYSYGEGWQRKEWLPQLARDIHQQLPDDSARQIFSTALPSE